MGEEQVMSVAEVFDGKELLARCMGNRSMAERILAKFQAGFEAGIAELEDALQMQNRELTACIAHRIKGASATTGAHRLRERAAEIEELARQDRLPEIPRHIEGLRGEWKVFEELGVSIS